MGVTGSFQITFSAGGTGTSMSGFDNENGAQLIQQPQVPFPANSNASPFSLAFSIANCQMVYLCATQACTINTSINGNVNAVNSSITLVANIPRIWGASQGYGANPFNGNVNGAWLSCNAATLLNLAIITT